VPEVAARSGKVRTRKAAAATEATAHIAATEAAAHMAAAAEPATVSTATATATATRKRVGGQSPGESGSHSQNNHAFA
jgi:hypothetical protein